MSALQSYTLQEIRKRLDENCLPFSGITELGSCEFRFLKPSFHAGIVMHAGSRIRSGISESLQVSQQDQFREEDPYMETFIGGFPIQIIARDSRFEYDLNREPEQAVYPFDQLKYGLKVWQRELTAEEIRESVEKHNEFHGLIDILVAYMLKLNRYALVFDMHSYCYQREEKKEWHADNRPEINIGTGAVNRDIFSAAIETYIKDLSGLYINKHPVRVAENEIFLGGHLARRLSKTWFNEVLVLALEYKKIFMDEWSGEVYKQSLDALVNCFSSATAKLLNSPAII